MAIEDGSSDAVSTLTEVGLSIVAHKELETTLRLIAEKGAKGTRSPVVVVEVAEGSQGTRPRLYSWYGISEQEAAGLSDFIPFCKRIYSEKTECFIKDYCLETEGAVPSFVHSHRIKTLTAFPLLWEDQAIGTLCFFRSKKITFNREEKSLASALSIQTAIAIQQADLIRERRANYVRTIRILADIMDRKDSYTHGHSARVMEYTLMIADRIGLKAKERQVIGDGGYLHDLGKINVDLSILQKPGKLTPQEWERMILHPDMGAEIVSETGVLRELAPIIRHHHEMFAGGGYPDGLKRDQIPLGSRIVAVASL
jgi:putative nucleotidyltransferase with HDIG domain